MQYKIYVINLERSKDRRANVISQFKKWGITSYEFVPGLDASLYSKQELQGFLDKERLVKSLPDGMIGCCMGHVAALRKVSSQDAVDYALIMEDDFIIKGDILNVIRNLDANILNAGPILLYGTLRSEISLKEIQPLDKEHSVYEFQAPFEIYSAVGYLVNKKIAANLVQVMFPIRDCSDSWFYYFTNNAFQKLNIIFPFLMEHEVFESDRADKGLLSIAMNKIISKKIPLLYPLLRKYRQKSVYNDQRLIRFAEN